MTLKDIKSASVKELRDELAKFGDKNTGPREVLEAMLMFHLPLEEMSKVTSPNISGAIEEMKSVSISNMAEGSLYAVLIGSSDAELRAFIRGLDSTYKSNKKETSIELVERAGLAFSNTVHDACDNDVLKDENVVSVLQSTATALGLKPPTDSKKACAFFRKELNTIEKLVVIAKSSNTKKGFWSKLGASVTSGVKGVFHGLWTMTKFIASTMKDLASKAWPLLLKGGALVGVAALACKASPENCLDLFNSVYEFLCPRIKWLPGQASLCKLINSTRCSLLLGAAKHFGKLVGNYTGDFASAAIAGPVLKTAGGSMLTTAYSMATAWIGAGTAASAATATASAAAAATATTAASATAAAAGTAAATGIGALSLAPFTVPVAIGMMVLSASIWMYSGHAGSAVAEFVASGKYSCTMDTSVTGKIWSGMSGVWKNMFGA